MVGLLAVANDDLRGGLARWPFWTTLGWYDVRRRYRRSVFGPLWTTLSIAIFVAALGLLYSKLFNRAPEVYVPHLALGMLAWTLLASIIDGGCQVFISAERYIKEIGIPLSTFVFRMIWRSVIIFLYQSILFVAVALIFDIRPGPVALLAVAGLALIILNAMWVELLLGILATRYRDIPEIIGNVIRIVFFLTPIIWMPDMVGRRTELLDFNPFYHFVELIRAPLLGHEPETLAWLTALGAAIVGWPAALLVFARFKNRVAYWL